MFNHWNCQQTLWLASTHSDHQVSKFGNVFLTQDFNLFNILKSARVHTYTYLHSGGVWRGRQESGRGGGKGSFLSTFWFRKANSFRQSVHRVRGSNKISFWERQVMGGGMFIWWPDNSGVSGAHRGDHREPYVATPPLLPLPPPTATSWWLATLAVCCFSNKNRLVIIIIFQTVTMICGTVGGRRQCFVFPSSFRAWEKFRLLSVSGQSLKLFF